MIDRRELLSGAVLLATSAAIPRAWAQVPLDRPMRAAVHPARFDEAHADARAAAAKVGPMAI